MFKRFLRKEKLENKVKENDYERNKRLQCEKYFQERNLKKWQTKDLPSTMLEALYDIGLVTLSDTIVYLPQDVIKVIRF